MLNSSFASRSIDLSPIVPHFAPNRFFTLIAPNGEINNRDSARKTEKPPIVIHGGASPTNNPRLLCHRAVAAAHPRALTRL